MNAYEKRKSLRDQKRAKYSSERRVANLLLKYQAEKFYEDAFVALQGRKPKVIPRMSPTNLHKAANLMYARLHEQQLGGNDE